jgi:hypothetical protein
MATFNFFSDFFERLGKKEIDLNGDTLKVILTNTAPNAATHTTYGDGGGSELDDLATDNGYTKGGEDIQNGYTETDGTGTLTAVDVVWTPTANSIGPFRYAVIYDDTHASDALIGWVDFGSEITATYTPVLMPITVNFGASLLTIAVAA